MRLSLKIGSMPNSTELPALTANLEDVLPGAEATVSDVSGSTSLRKRLLEMGFVAGTRVRVVRFAPLGDPMEIVLHGYHISLRRSEARAILVEA